MTDMEKMQAEAVSSARAMYRRRTPSTRTVQSPPPPETEPPKTEPPPEVTDGAVTKTDIFSSLFEDKEKTLIILLIALLSEDGADPGVIMALLYCIL